jgi:hypothetical protein
LPQKTGAAIQHLSLTDKRRLREYLQGSDPQLSVAMRVAAAALHVAQDKELARLSRGLKNEGLGL